MKKMKSLILFSISSIVFTLLYLDYDSKGYNFGLDSTFCCNEMPFGLKPRFNFDYPQEFVLLDNDDFELVGSRFKFQDSSFEIRSLLAYGYSDTSVVVKCTDSLNNIKYLLSYETGYRSKKGHPEISFKDIDSSLIELYKVGYQWFEIDEEKAYNIRFAKLIFMIGASFSIFFLIRKFRSRPASS